MSDMDWHIKKAPVASRGGGIAPDRGRRGGPGVSRPRPKEVPALILGELLDSDEEDVTYIPASERPVRFGPPDSSSTMSWGTMLSTQHSQTARGPLSRLSTSKKEDEWVVPESLAPPSERYKVEYEQYKLELKDSWRQHTQRAMVSEVGTKSAESAVKPTKGCATDKDGWTREDANAHLNRCHVVNSCTTPHSMRKIEAEEVAMEKRKQAVVHQVMVDQLSRAVISDPDQDSSLVEQNSFPAIGSVPLRFKKRTLHETKVKTSSSLTENLLSNKLRFDARILSRNGRDACRELIGFFFTYDKTLTVYEYRHFGKNRANALPFLPKGCYIHQCGRRAGLQYDIHDFYVGASLSFSTYENNLPESMKRTPLLWIRITGVDELAKGSLLSLEDIKLGLSKEELDDKNILLAIQATLQQQLRKRAVRTITRLGRLLRNADESDSGTLGKAEVLRALEEHHLDLSQKDFDSMWHVLDCDGDGRVDYGEFMRGAFGEMNEYRKAFVLKAYMKLDPTKSGTVSITDIEKFFGTRGHLKIVSSEATEEELRGGLIESLHHVCSDPSMISFCEFEDYYEGLSMGISNDQDFANLLKNSWGI